MISEPHQSWCVIFGLRKISARSSAEQTKLIKPWNVRASQSFPTVVVEVVQQALGA